MCWHSIDSSDKLTDENYASCMVARTCAFLKESWFIRGGIVLLFALAILLCLINLTVDIALFFLMNTDCFNVA